MLAGNLRRRCPPTDIWGYLDVRALALLIIAPQSQWWSALQGLRANCAAPCEDVVPRTDTGEHESVQYEFGDLRARRTASAALANPVLTIVSKIRSVVQNLYDSQVSPLSARKI